MYFFLLDARRDFSQCHLPDGNILLLFHKQQLQQLHRNSAALPTFQVILIKWRRLCRPIGFLGSHQDAACDSKDIAHNC